LVKEWGTPGYHDGEFATPVAIAVDSNGYVYVVEFNNHRLQKFDSDVKFVMKWGTELEDIENFAVNATGNGQFAHPIGVAVDLKGYVYVVDLGNNQRIQKFDSDGKFIAKWDRRGSGDGEFYLPMGVAVDLKGYVYVADLGNQRIQKFDSDGKFITKWGTYGSEEGEFDSPSAVAVDQLGYVYVADRDNQRIQKFDSDGKFIAKWGTYGSEEGEFNNPTGVAVDQLGYVYVTDRFNHRIQKFDSDGKFIAKWGTYGSEEGEFKSPSGIAVDQLGYVYVADRDNDRIQKFKSDVLSNMDGGEFVLLSTIDGKTYTITGKAERPTILSFTIKPNESLSFDLSGAGGEVELSIARDLIGEIHSIMVGERQIPFQQTHSDASSTTIRFRIPENANSLEIKGMNVIPEFPFNLMMVMAIALTGLMFLFRFKRINLY
jgi:DNA-binding beta-propeller fold protein YncE